MSNHAQGWRQINQKSFSLLEIHPALLALGGLAIAIIVMVAGGYLAEAILPTFPS